MRNRNVFMLIAVLSGAFACGGDDQDGGLAGRSDALCARICARSAKAHCKADPERDECVDTCEAFIDETPRQCEEELEAFTRCAEKASFTCDRAGESEAKSCTKQLNAWAGCMNGQSGARDGGVRVPSTPSTPSFPTTPTTGRDAGTDAGTDLGGACGPSADDDACSTCTKASCCDEIAACGAACQGVFKCVQACTTQACVQSCVQASPTGAQQFVALGECQETSCTAACAGDTTSGDTPSTGTPSTGDGSDPFASGDCLPRGSVPAGHCNVAGRPNAYECVRPPFPGCVASPTGVEDIYCCSQ